MTTIRAFIAIDLSAEARAAVADLQNRLKGRLVPRTVRWTAPPNMHLTLHFLGNVVPDSLEDIEAALARTAAVHAPFRLDLVGLGCFPNARRPRVVWVGIGGQTEALVAMQHTLGQQLKQATGFTPESRPYAPHLTIGRVKKGLPSRKLSQVGQLITQEQPRVKRLARLPVGNISLVQSDLTPTGPIYTTLARQSLERKA